MKKTLTLMAVLCAALLLASCSSNTPSAVAERSVKCLMDGKYDEYADLLYVSDKDTDDPSRLKQEKEDFVQLLEAKYQETLKRTGGIDKYEIVSEEIAQDGETATVNISLTYKNGRTEDYTTRLRKDANGDWKITLGK